MNCDDARAELPGSVDGALSSQVQCHVGECLRCQAEVSHYQRLRRVMRGMEAETIVPPVPIADGVFAQLSPLTALVATARRGRRNVAIAVGATAAVAAGIVGVVAASSRSKRLVALASN